MTDEGYGGGDQMKAFRISHDGPDGTRTGTAFRIQAAFADYVGEFVVWDDAPYDLQPIDIWGEETADRLERYEIEEDMSLFAAIAAVREQLTATGSIPG